eukprot:TRINITY_DN184_c5_g1_i1.p1 TRINITY_DN184_c5_g1~~TRINITY_DN184_c5_g1_i1.p1  ORF type:complete len:185 (-),score=23.86 TRINITY_DN184_c5_g1_i1:91-645(-)
MGLLKILRKMKLREKDMRILTLGLDNAGKTTCVKKFKGEDTREISPTLGFNIDTFEYSGYSLNLWDIGGQKSLRSYWRNYFEQTDGIIWVVDSADKQRLEDCRDELHKLLQEEKLAGASLLIYANKQDLDGALGVSQLTTLLGLEQITTRHWRVEPCSAVTGDGLVAGIDWLVTDISSRVFMLQ